MEPPHNYNQQSEEEVRGKLRCGNPHCICARDGGNVHCPAHHDRNPSLSVKMIGGKLLVHCYAGCSGLAVLAAIRGEEVIKRETARQAPAQKRRPRSVIETVYRYFDAHSVERYQVVRFYPKSFGQRRIDTDGRYVWNMDGVDLILYKLPEVIEAVHLGRTVFVVEGEKDVDTLFDLGFVATTCPQGAGKWKPSYSEFLRGAKVIIIPDNDDAGRNHAAFVKSDLVGKAKSVRFLVLPGLLPKDDVSDWLRTHIADELRALILREESR